MRFQVGGLTPTRIGLDAEALSGPEWGDYHTKLALSFAWQVRTDAKHGGMEYLPAKDMVPGKFNSRRLLALKATIETPGAIIVAHNAGYDLGLLNGTLMANHLPPLSGPIQYQDTMDIPKTGQAFRRKLSDMCRMYGVNLKEGSPDWRAVMQRDVEEWSAMRYYNENDVLCTLELEAELRRRDLTPRIKVWRGR